MSAFTLFYRLILRPLLKESGRTLLMVIAVAVGASVVLAIDLASNAAAGSFRASMETLAGENDLEVIATGGVPEQIVGKLATLPYALRLSPRIEDSATVVKTGEAVPLIGLDMIAEFDQADDASVSQAFDSASFWTNLKPLQTSQAIWVTASLGLNPGDHVDLLVNDQHHQCTVAGVIPKSTNLGSDAIAMDIAAAQQITGRFGRVDRILIKLPEGSDVGKWRQILQSQLPAGLQVQAQGTQTEANRKMLQAFRWNLRILSYVAVLVGAFLIFNTISVSVVRRRPDIGTLRALGATRRAVLLAFLAEALVLGIAGSILALPLGRIMASGAVRLLALTVNALYISSHAGQLVFSTGSVLLAFTVGIGVALLSAAAPAREAARVSPVEAMARGAREYDVRVHRGRDAWFALALAAAATLFAQAPAIHDIPFFGYLSALMFVASSALFMPVFSYGVTQSCSALLHRTLGVEGLLAGRSLAGSLRRTAVLVGALSTAVAMMASVAIMVGSFRQSVISWMDTQFPADLYLRPHSNPVADRHPTMDPQFVDRLAELPGVSGVSRFQAYEIQYQGLPITVAALDLSAPRTGRESGFISGRPPAVVLRDLSQPDTAVVSEPFTVKHHLTTGDFLTLPLGEQLVRLRIVDVFYDYGSERGLVMVGRPNLLHYLPAPAIAAAAVFLAPGADLETVRREVLTAAANHDVFVMSNRDLRQQAVRVFDQTFAITYALEAISVLVAVLGIAGALMSIVIDRRREFGLLRFLGASTGQIRKLILVEAGWLGFLSVVAGLVLGYVLSLVLIYVINKQSFGWTIRFHWPFAILAGALAVVYTATVLAGLYPARMAQRLNPIEVVHEE